ncbi:hypothetical protein [Acinetobacter soli]|uniref:PIN like domain-containing protein n=1 Tax=Acinetobacter soli NIPH 2899 TaxID=1217677 RepID=A0ABP2U7V0_9GAMM|nr:hypothetical protein [Acinetobacter soli]ENV60824.1 hypothetical protein F950_01550 [Acinetobacter soli NIPH 2899]WEH88963.1 hypothetical protein PX669_16290 [Acinetobacter soli]WEI09136.1 hypothetical protein PYR73_12605 [Acinetobacter soli]
MEEEHNYSGKPLAYLDQNILDRFIDCQTNDLDFFNGFKDRVQVVYSDSTFQEIYRSGLTDKRYSDNFLKLLENFKAFYLKPVLDKNFKLTGKMRVYSGSIFNHYNEYINESMKYDYIMNPLQRNIFALYGGVQDYDAMANEQIGAQYKILEFLGEQIRILKKEQINHPILELFINQKEKELYTMKAQMPDFEATVLKNIENLRQANSETDAHLAHRSSLKINVDQINKVEYPNVIIKIWNMLKADNTFLQEIELDDFLQIRNCHFNFEKIHAIYTILNLSGFRPEKKVKNIKKFVSAQSDILHVAFASYCDFFITNDERLFDKSRVIYEYLKINTEVLNIPEFK